MIAPLTRFSRSRCRSSLGAAATALLLAACGETPATTEAQAPAARAADAPTFHAEGAPERLSAWGQLVRAGGSLAPADGVLPYDLNTPLFSDYARKLRTIWIPEGAAQWREDETFDFPVGTVITKTFYYPTGADGAVRATAPAPAAAVDLGAARLMETRVLVRRAEGWAAFPYVWEDQAREARLARAGDLTPLTIEFADGERRDFAYLVPNANQCRGCHATDATTRAMEPIGPKARHMNRDFPYKDGTENQLARLAAMGWLEGAPAPGAAPRAAAWTDETAPIAARARAWLDVNCAHCHNPVGPADTSGLHLGPDASGPHLGACKPPIAAGRGSGGRRFGIVPGAPDESILLYRVESEDPSEMMPELGRALAHREGAALMRGWIASMSGGCPG